MILILFIIAFQANSHSQKYKWSPCITSINTEHGKLKARFEAAFELGIAQLKDGNLISKPGVILAGDNILTITKATVWDDQESNPDWIFIPIPKIKDEFGKGNIWANWHIRILDPYTKKELHKTHLQGPALSPSGSCEWADEKDFRPQILTYNSYGIWDWDWIVNGKKYDEVLVFLYEGDRGFYDDEIGYFEVSRNKTIFSSLNLSDTDYYPNPDGHDVDLVFKTSSYNLHKINERKEYENKKPQYRYTDGKGIRY